MLFLLIEDDFLFSYMDKDEHNSLVKMKLFGANGDTLCMFQQEVELMLVCKDKSILLFMEVQDVFLSII